MKIKSIKAGKQMDSIVQESSINNITQRDEDRSDNV